MCLSSVHGSGEQPSRLLCPVPPVATSPSFAYVHRAPSEPETAPPLQRALLSDFRTLCLTENLGVTVSQAGRKSDPVIAPTVLILSGRFKIGANVSMLPRKLSNGAHGQFGPLQGKSGTGLHLFKLEL